MTELQFTLAAEERECLVGVLQRVLTDTRIEEHRTRTPAYRDHILHEEELLVGVLNKLGAATTK
jgi:hypothetical protein